MGSLVAGEQEVGAHFLLGFAGVGVSLQANILILHSAPQPAHSQQASLRTLQIDEEKPLRCVTYWGARCLTLNVTDIPLHKVSW